MIRNFLLALVCLAFNSGLQACPLVDGLYADWNCDQQLKIAFVGDSIVQGVGDERNENNGGYVLRLKRRLGQNITGFGIPGVHSDGLLRALQREFENKNQDVIRKFRNADVIVIDVGRNDYWSEEHSAGETARNIKRLVEFFRLEMAKRGVKPYLAVATLLPTLRVQQGYFLSDINEVLINYKSEDLPTSLRFDKVSPSALSADGLHPNSRGYGKVASFAEKYIRNNLQKLLERKLPDNDGDGIYNKYESRYFTDPNNADTDGDGFLDGEEVFELLTNPLDSNDPVPTPSPSPIP